LPPHCPIWSLTMDVVHLCLSLTPVPCLSQTFSVLRFIWSSIERANASKCQLEALAQSIAQLLKALNGEYQAGRLLQARTSTPLADLHRFVKFIMLCIVIYSSTLQAPGRNISFCAEGSVALCTTVSHLLETTPVARSAQDSSPGVSLETPSITRPTPDAAHARPSTPLPNLIIRGHKNEVWCAMFSFNGKHIVSGSTDRTIRVWDAQTGNPVLGPLKMHAGVVYSVAFSPNGRRIASGSSDKIILVWDALTGKRVAGPFKGHTNSIWSVCFSPDSQRIASSSLDKTVRIWDAHTGNPLVGPLSGHTMSVTSVAFSGDGARIASGSYDKTVRVWDVKSGRLILGPLTGHRDSVDFVAFSPDSKRIVSASQRGNVCVWNADTGAQVSGPLWQHRKGALAVEFTPNDTSSAVSPDGRWIAAYADNTLTTVSVWDSRTGQVAASVGGHTDQIITITFSPDSRRVLTASCDKTIRVHTLDS
jgi:WD40 repeat protein